MDLLLCLKTSREVGAFSGTLLTVSLACVGEETQRDQTKINKRSQAVRTIEISIIKVENYHYKYVSTCVYLLPPISSNFVTYLPKIATLFSSF